ncbi:MAG: class A beta-lactamase [Gammaproteobacteria bacterium]|nr:MAG: class A beta-lactamase [Gammaproteobacteria bacterium]
MLLTRRHFSKLLGSTIALSATSYSVLAQADKKPHDLLTQRLAELEKKLGGRLGVFILDTQTGKHWAQRANERFPMCSTFKLIACGAVLAKVDAGKEDLNRRVYFEKNDLVANSPITEKHAGSEGMTFAEICEAAITRSDNTAANIILKSLNGPSAVTAFARTLGDSVSQLDRYETELNEATPGDIRDTTSPSAMAGNVNKLLLGNTLTIKSREQLKTWLVANKTGDAKLRAGLPKEWIVGDKTGAGSYGTTNDVAIIWPTNRKPIITSIYITEPKVSFDECNAAFAEIGRAITAEIN